MGESLPHQFPAAKPPEDRLDSWKEIAAYLNRDVTTVQRWEKREGMPVHRHLHDRMGSVYASRSELDAWGRGRNLRVAPETLPADPSTSPPKPQSVPSNKWKLILPLALVGLALGVGAIVWLQKTDYFWRNPLDGARFQTITDFDGVSRDAALSSDGHLVAFLSDHDGPMDVWVSQVGSGEFHNLTHGSAPGLVNPSIRTLGFSPDAAFVTFWFRKPDSASNNGISVWAVPTLGGPPRPYLEAVAEFDWTRDGSRLAYHTSGPGDPLYVSSGATPPNGQPIFTAPTGLHAHFPSWSPDGAFIYFIEGSLPDQLAIWRVAAKGGAAERITPGLGYISYPVLLNNHTLIYVAADPDGSGRGLYGIDLTHRKPHRLTQGPERYTSLAASADGRRVVATLTTPKRTLWRLPLTDSSPELSAPSEISLTTRAGSSPRLGPDYLLYVAAAGTREGIWKLTNGIGAELWSAPGAKILGGPAISSDGHHIAFSVQQHGQKFLYVMQPDGGGARVIADSLDLQGDLAWAHDGRSITTAVNDHGVPHLFQVPIGGGPPVPVVKDYSVDPVWERDGRFAVYSGPDIGTTFSIKAMKPDGTAQRLPPLTLTRGARHVVFAPDGRSLILLRGEIQHKDLWSIELSTGAGRQLTRLPADFDIDEFDLSPDGREVVLERLQERSDIVLLELARH